MVRMPIGGGDWNNGANAGLAALNLNNRRVNSNSNIGFRPALPYYRMPIVYGRSDGVMGKRSRVPSRQEENINSRTRLVGIARTPPRGAFTMKTINGIWRDIIDFENLYIAYKSAARGKRYRRAQLEFSANLEDNLTDLQDELATGMWKPSPSREFYVTDPKRRLISAPPFRDRVVHHALVRVIEPIIDRRFVYDSHACRAGHGTHCAVRRVQEFTRCAKRMWGGYYVYKGDIKSYFPSIHHEMLKSIIRRSISDRHVLALIDQIIADYRDAPRGLPIGALTSQLFANAYLDPLDHFAKEHLMIRFYLRYMDDFVAIIRDKSDAQSVSAEIEHFACNELLLKINPKSGIHPGKLGIHFCGFRVWPTHILARRSTIRRAFRRLKKLTATAPQERVRASVMSFLGHLKHASAHRTTESILNRIVIKGGRS